MGCGALCGRPGASGHLIIEPGAARFEFGRVGVRLGIPPVIHARPPLILLRARLLPPGLNSGLILRGDEGTATLLTWWGIRGRVRRALAEADVAFLERWTWLSIGWGEGASWAAPTPRSQRPGPPPP